MEFKSIKKMKRVNNIIHDDVFLKLINEIHMIEKNRKFCLHGIEHLLNVARMMQILNLEEDLHLDKEVIYGAALLHDIGRCEQYYNNGSHAQEGAIIAEDILFRAGYDKDEIEEICNAIKEHNNIGKSTLSKLLKFVDKRSRNCFLCNMRNECYWDDNKKNFDILR